MNDRYLAMSENLRKVADCIEEQLCDCKEDCRKGRLSGSMYRLVVQTFLNTLDNWTPRLNASMRSQIADWFESEYGLCL